MELLLEGTVFLDHGRADQGDRDQRRQDHAGVGGLLIAAGALVLTVLVRAAYVAPLLGVLARRGRRSRSADPDAGHAGADDHAGGQTRDVRGGEPPPAAADVSAHARPVRPPVTQSLADIDTSSAHRSGGARARPSSGRACAGRDRRRGPDPAGRHPAAFGPGARRLRGRRASLLVQGGTIGPLLRRITPRWTQRGRRADRDRAARILRAHADQCGDVPEPPHRDGDPTPEEFAVARGHRSRSSRPSGRHCSTRATTAPSTRRCLPRRWKPRRVPDRHRDARQQRGLRRPAPQPLTSIADRLTIAIRPWDEVARAASGRWEDTRHTLQLWSQVVGKTRSRSPRR